MAFYDGIKEQIKTKNNKIDKRKEELRKINPKKRCGRGVISLLNESMQENEKVLYFTSGSCEKKFYNVFVTNKKVILLSSILLQKEQLQVPIEKISSISANTGFIFGRIQIWDGSSSSVIVEKVTNNDAKKFVNKVNEQINNYKSFKIEIKTNLILLIKLN